MLRQVVADIEPGRFRVDENMLGGSYAGIVIKRTKCQAEVLWPFADDELKRRPAFLTKCARHRRRRLIGRKVVRARQQREVFSFDAAVCGKCSSVCFSAHDAMAVVHPAYRTAYLVANTAAKATSSNHLYSPYSALLTPGVKSNS